MKNFILDVDGTMWNSTPVVAEAWNSAIIADGSSQVRVTDRRLQQLFGKPMNVIGELLFTDVDTEARERLLTACEEAEQKTLREGEFDILYPGVKDTLKKLAEEHDARLFIVSNCQSGYIELFMEKNQIESLITDTLCYGDTGQGKGENIRTLMEKNGLSAQDTAYVGDIRGDYEASKQAGISFIFASYGFGEVPEAEYKIEKFEEILKYA